MTPRQILSINASATAITAVAMLAVRSALAPLFGLGTPLLLDVTAVSFLIYAGVIALAAARRPVAREALLAFAAIDVAWVVFSAVVLLLFWSDLTPVARALVLVVALIVEVFATLQYRAAGGLRAQTTMSGSHA
jgi:hypothetical protein